MDERQIVTLFKDVGFRATPQRVAVYKYLLDNRTHPDADEVYCSVLNANPSFSKTTVYNSLQALEKNGFIQRITIDANRVRYDACVDLHGHFICDKCNKIFDFNVGDVCCNLGVGFDVTEKNVYYRGLCPECK